MLSNKISSILKHICCCFYKQNENDTSQENQEYRDNQKNLNGFENPLYSETGGDELLYRIPTIDFINPLFDKNFVIEQDSDYEHDITLEHNKNPMDPTSSNHDEWYNINSDEESKQDEI
jgi:hypothetical protein